MGLLDNVLGSAVPGGRYAKPLGIALLALLASRAMGGGGFGAGGRGGADEGGGGGLVGGGGLGGLLSGGLGGIIGGLMGGGGDTRTMPNQDQAHAAVSGGLGELLQRFQQSGFGDTVNSWIGTGANRPIAPDQLNQALSPETVDELSQQTGVPRPRCYRSCRKRCRPWWIASRPKAASPTSKKWRASPPNTKRNQSESITMRRITSLAAAAAILGYAGLALAQ
jgi:uncharacterized protein YidB (DUF937 family)